MTIKINIRRQIIHLSLIAAATFSFCKPAAAQLLPLNAQYFQNRYISNPSFAGTENKLNLNGTLRKQWSGISGSPINQSITLDRGYGRTGWGVNFFNEKAGGIQRTKMMGTFAYHLPLNNNDNHLNFGISFGASQDKFDMSTVKNADINDPSIALFNDQGNYFDGDFGLSYTSKGLNVEAAIPNMRSVFRKDDANFADKATFYSAVSYRIQLGAEGEKFNVEPKAVLRGVKNYSNLWDVGVNANFIGDRLSAMGIYHSTKNATFGIGMNYKSTIYFMAYYNSSTSAVAGYSGGDFEVNIRAKIGK